MKPPTLLCSAMLNGILPCLTCVLAWMFSLSSLSGAPLNIVFFLVDDLGWRDLGCYGSTFHETPHVNRLAESGVRFTQAYAACHVCSPTRASILTGRHPARLHLTDWLPGRKDHPFQVLRQPEIQPHLPAEETTLAEVLQSHGYRTAIFGKWHLGEEPHGPTSQGFDVQVPRWNKGWPNAGYHAPFRLNGLEESPGDYLTDRLTDAALGFIRENVGRPFFLYLSHFAVHDPIQGREDRIRKYREKLARQSGGKGPAFILEGNPDEPDATSETSASHSGFRVFPDRTVKIRQRQDNPVFASMVDSMDESLGRVLSTLKELNLEEQTLIVFFSDNGGMSAANFGNPGRVVDSGRLNMAYSTSNLPLRGAKGWLYEGGIRVPLILRHPGETRPGRTCDVPVLSTDLFPTILEWAGLPARPDLVLDGTSLIPILNGQAQDRGPLFWHFPHYSNHGMQSPGGAIRDGDFKLLEYFEHGTVQLFNLSQDLSERRDLSGEMPEKAMAMRQRLHEWRQAVSAQMPMPKTEPIEALR